jgi:ribulose-5-phosphate 4-epimerase/fuculose-1-phosphate aldolase
MGRLEPECISKVDWEGRHLSGDKPSKEVFLHLLMLKERPQDGAVVHLHSTHSVAVSCLEDMDPGNVLPPITPYYVMRVGRLPRVPYYRPGDQALAKAVAQLAREHHAVLLAHHGPVVSGPDLHKAVDAIEELEETAKLFLLLKGQKTRYLTKKQIDEIERAFPR